jgi:hypothetical protein
VLADVGQRHTLERQLARALGIVVAIRAVAADDVLRSSRALLGARLAGRRGEGERNDGERAHNLKNLREKSSRR